MLPDRGASVGRVVSSVKILDLLQHVVGQRLQFEADLALEEALRFGRPDVFNIGQDSLGATIGMVDQSGRWALPLDRHR